MALRIIIIALMIVAMVSIFGLVFNILFKVGILLLLFAGVVYLIKKIIED